MRLASCAAIVAVLVISISASAETYRISGTATYSDESPVMYADLTIECGDTEYDCHPFRGESTTTDRMGEYSLEIELDETYDGAELLLSLMGENTSHIVDTAKMDEPPGGTAIQDISIDRAAPPSPVFSGIGCGIMIFSLAAGMIIARTARRLSTSRGRAEFVGYRAPRMVDCPDCDYRIEQHLLIRHLIVDHEHDALEASEVAAKAFRSTWSEQASDGAGGRI